VVQQGEGDRNFHIFYQLLAGGQAAALGIDTSAKKYRYLSGGTDKAAGINDKTWCVTV